MNLQVKLKCPECGREVTIYVLGAWDIADVRHVCSTRFEITYEPPRPVY